MADARIVVVGSSNTAPIVQTDPLPAAGATVMAGDLVTAAGGAGATQAVPPAGVGARVTPDCRTGRDMFGTQTLQQLQREGMDLTYFQQDPSAPAGVALIVVGPGGQNLIAVAPGANHRVTPDDVAAAAPAFAGCQVVVLQLEVPVETVLAAAQAGRAAGATVVLNPAPAMSFDEALYGLIDIITPNEHEAALLTGTADPEAAASALLQRGPRTV